MPVLMPDGPVFAANPLVDTVSTFGSYGPIDVRGFESVIVKLTADALNDTAISCSWGSEYEVRDGGQPSEHLGSAGGTAIAAGDLTMQMRNLGPFMRVDWSTGRTPTDATAEIWLTNHASRYSSPHSPGQAGNSIFHNVSSYTANLSVTYDLFGYCGPALLSLSGSVAGGTGGPCTCRVLDPIFGPDMTAGALGAPLTGRLAAGMQRIWVPPRPVTLQVLNGATAQEIQLSVIADE